MLASGKDKYNVMTRNLPLGETAKLLWNYVNSCYISGMHVNNDAINF